MANTLNTNPISIDTFGADVTLRANVANVRNVTFTSTAADHCVLTDKRGAIVFDSRVSANGSDSQHIGVNVQGLILDVSLGTYAGTAALLVYLK